MEIKIRITSKNSHLLIPLISISVNEVYYATEVKINNTSLYIAFDALCIKDHNSIKISASNLIEGDQHGFTVDQIIVDSIDMMYFTTVGKIVCYIPNNDINSSYVTEYLKPQNKLNEIFTLNEKLVHVRVGKWENFVCMPNSYFEFNFNSPIYKWLYTSEFKDVFSSNCVVIG
jgi:hypothetical protein